jgi:hypothetical protein
MLQAGRSRVRLLMSSSDIAIDLIFPAALWPWGRLTAICEPIVYKMCEPRRLTTLWASTAFYRDSFTFTSTLQGQLYVFTTVRTCFDIWTICICPQIVFVFRVLCDVRTGILRNILMTLSPQQSVDVPIQSDPNFGGGGPLLLTPNEHAYRGEAQEFRYHCPDEDESFVPASSLS